MTDEQTPPIDRCPFCEDEGIESTGTRERRLLIGGRVPFRCPRDSSHLWCDEGEPVQSSKGTHRIQ